MYLFLRYFKKLQFLKFICPNLISRAPSKSNTNCIKQSTSIITKLSYNLNESFAFLKSEWISETSIYNLDKV